MERKNKKTKHKKIFVYIIIALVLVFFISIFFVDFPNKIVSFFLKETPYSLSAETLFDVSLSITPESGEVKAGEELIATVKIINMGIAEAEDVIVEYSLWDKKREHEISKSAETIAVQTSISIVKHIKIPESLVSGDYIIDVAVIYGEEEAGAQSSFIVRGNKSFFNYELFIIIMGIFISLILLYIVYLLKRSQNK